MRILFFILIALFIAFSGMFLSPRTPLPALLTAVAAYLVFEVLALRRRLAALEETMTKMRQATQAQEPLAKAPPVAASASEKEEYQPEVPLGPDRPAVGHAHSVSPSLPPQPTPAWGHLGRLLQSLSRYCTQGNPVLKIGMVIVFFGVAFFLKYAAQRNLIPIELRLSGVALGGIGLLVLGWVLRRKHEIYGLGLEGGGIGVLYLCVFAAAKLYHLLPYPLALAVMIGLVGLSCAMAVLQDARGLATAGSIGGFLAPVLLSTGTGSHVLLFSYYALLNCGILGIAWFKAWRELNLIGFVFTFGIGAFWGASAYVPDFFATTEPFLILFFLMYTAVAVLFAHRQPLQLRGFIDGPLVFGLPVVTGGLQACLVRDMPYGLALSALALGFFYIVLTRLLWRRLAGEMRQVTEAFLALGAVFASLAIPFGLDPEWTTAAWALEGAAMIWVGTRQNRKLARLFGLMLQAGAALTFVAHSDHSGVSLLFANRFFLGCALIAVAALFSSFWLERGADGLQTWEKTGAPLLMAWGLAWWYCGGYRELEHGLDWNALAPAFLLFACMTTAGLGLIVRRFRWHEAAKGLLLLLPIMALTLASQSPA